MTLRLSKGKVVLAIIPLLLAAWIAWGGPWPQSRSSNCDLLVPDNAPGVYEVASTQGLNLSVADVHRYDEGQGSFILTLGLVAEGSGQGSRVDPSSFEILDSSGGLNPALKSYALKNPLAHRELAPGEVVVGSLAFSLKEGSRPLALVDEATGVKIRLDKEVRPPGVAYPPGTPVATDNCVLGIEEISRSDDGMRLRIDYLLKNSGGKMLSLEERSYGKFGVLLDSHGTAYPAYQYKILAGALIPGASAEGYMTYVLPEDSTPRYLLFWPPGDDAVLFDLTAEAT